MKKITTKNNDQQQIQGNQTLSLILLSIILTGTLINNNIFGPQTLTAFFFYSIPAMVFVLVVSVSLFSYKQSIFITNPLPLLFFVLLVAYYLVNGSINNQSGGINLRHYYMLVNGLLLISYSILLVKGSFRLLTMSYIIVILAGIEAVICILQQLRVVNSKDELFAVTGTCINPNVTAMFLAMAIPAILFAFFYGTKVARIITGLVILTTISALVVLKCRTAFIGSTVATVFILDNRHQLLYKLKRRYNKTILVAIALFAVCLLVATSVFLYYSKQSSSEGRKFIWKISLNMLANKPITGAGYGQFEHDYNLAQANYFKQGLGTPNEINNAAYVHMSYNELLENVAEGGIIGLIIFTGFLVVLLINPSSSTDKTTSTLIQPGNALLSIYPFAYSGIAAFAVMSILNFTVQALPAMGIFVLYASICIVGYKGNVSWKLPQMPVVSLLGILSVFVCFQLVVLAKDYNQCKNSKDNAAELGLPETISQMEALQPVLKASVFYWRGYGNILYQYRNYASALDKFTQASYLSSDPDLYMMMGNCYVKTANYVAAKQAYIVAQNIEPHHFAPRYALMKIYAFTKDTASALLMARKIVTMQPKIPSDKITQYKKVAEEMSEKLKNKII